MKSEKSYGPFKGKKAFKGKKVKKLKGKKGLRR